MRDTFVQPAVFKSQVAEELRPFEVYSKTKVSVIIDFISGHANQAKAKNQKVNLGLLD